MLKRALSFCAILGTLVMIFQFSGLGVWAVLGLIGLAILLYVITGG